MRLRMIAPTLLVLAVTAGGFFATRLNAEGDARRDAQHRAEIAATEVRGGIEQASNLVESLRRLMLGQVDAGVTNAQFADVGARWLSPVGLPAAAWVERVPEPGARRSSLRATLVTGANPMTTRGIDLGGEAVLTAAVADPRTVFRVTATALAHIRDGRTGIFLVQSAPRLSGGVLKPGFVVLLVPGSWLLAEVTEEPNPRLQLGIGAGSYGGLGNATPVGSTFSAAGRRFEVLVPQEPVGGAAALLPWLILGGGIVLATLAGAVAAIAARRARAQHDVDRIFTLSSDLIIVAGFDGYWKRVNPAFQATFGFSEAEARKRQWLDFVHPADRERSAEEARRVAAGETTSAFEIRTRSKDDSYRWIEWTAVADVREHLLYGAGRDVTERRRAELEQKALRRIATLAAEGVEPEELFEVVAEEVARVIDVPVVSVVRYEADDSATACASFSTEGEPTPVGTRWSLDGTSAVQLVRESGEATRIDDYSDLEGELAEAARAGGLRSTVGVPIAVGGRIWGAMVVSSTGDPLPNGTEARLADFTELLATAIASAESHESLARLADEQAALRRVATLVAGGVPPADIFAAVTEEVGQMLPVGSAAMGRLDPDGLVTTVAAWSTGVVAFPVGERWMPEGRNATTLVLETGRPARIDDFADASGPVGAAAREAGYRSAVGTPIVVEGRLWGVMTAASSAEEPLPLDLEARLASFTELVATAIGNAESREALARLADEQAALRRVATLVAYGASPSAVLDAVAAEMERVLGADGVTLSRYEPEEEAVVVAHRGADLPRMPTGTRFSHRGENVASLVRRSERAARMEHREGTHGAIAELVRHRSVRASVGAPIVVESRLWGVAIANWRGEEPPAADTEERMAQFAQLLDTAIANAESREALARLADEQATLRRIATLVAQAVPLVEIVSTVSEEVGRLSGAETAGVAQFEHDPPSIVVVGVGKSVPGISIGTRSELDDGMASTEVYRSGQSARIDVRDWESVSGPFYESARDAGLTSTVASPISVEGRLWGTISVSATEPLRPNTEERLERFGELLATAIASAESRDALARLADEQAALRRMATLVAEGVSPTEIFSAVSEEVDRLFGSLAAVLRFEHDPPGVVFVGISKSNDVPIGTQREFQEGMASAEVFRTGRSARVDAIDRSSANGPLSEAAGRLSVSTVASPIIVDGRRWGAMSVFSTRDLLPADTEARLERFTELVATAIANADSRAELAASRRRIVTASDDARRRIERDLHDGTQQRLVSLGLAVRAVEANVPSDRGDLREELSHVATGLADAVEDLQEFSRGIHPAILSKGGLGPALQTLAHRSAVPVELDLKTDTRLPEPVEVAAYFVASEALANAAKHAQASRIELSLVARDGRVLLSIRDDGVGGADPARGSGLVGLSDRVEALGGSIRVRSRPGDGTHITAELPVELEAGMRHEAPASEPARSGG